MFPTLFELSIFGRVISVPSSGLVMVLAFVGAYLLTIKRVNATLKPHLSALLLVIVFCSSVGAVVFAMLVESPSDGYAGSSAFYGGLFGALIGLYGYSRLTRIQWFEILDLVAPSVAFGVFLGRVGCFLAGCCWGIESDLPWAVTFPHSTSSEWPPAHPVHPVQLYAAMGGLVLFMFLERVYRRRSFVGEVSLLFFVGYGSLRFVWEFLRGDGYRGLVLGGLASVSQVISLGLVALALYFFVNQKSAWATQKS